MTALERQRRADAADALCSAAFARALTGSPDTLTDTTGPHVGPGTPDESGLALVAVGGYGRRELAPHSDLDVILVHEDEVPVGDVAERVWYPLWDAGATVDHAVRALSEATAAAAADVRVTLGLLDARHLAGDPSVTLRLRSGLLAQWRAQARQRLPVLRQMVDDRVEQLGELAHATVPDLKGSGGGLRDATILNALVATWLVDVPHADLERSRLALLDVRDALHAVAGRATDRVGPDMWSDLAAALGDVDAAASQRRVREIGRRITHISRLTWRRVEGVLAPPTPTGRRTPGPAMRPLGHGLAVAAGEVVVQRREAASDPTTLLRAAAEAAERDLILSPHTVARLARESPPLPDPWPVEARELLVRLLGAGSGLLAVWETLDETGALSGLLPEWERVRLLPHASQVHRFTVDRHQVETCIEASRLIRRVSRPDLLLVAALVHDIGKGGLREHSVAGEPVAAALAGRLGFDPADVAVIATLVRRHLLLGQVATTRDPEDPATVEHVAARVGDLLTLDLLTVLTEADARATSAKAWTPWRARLVAALVHRVRAALDGAPLGREPSRPPREVEPPEAVLRDRSRVDVHVEVGEHGAEVTVVTGDRVGVLAAVSGALALMRLPVRSARAWTQDDLAVSLWDLAETHLDPAVLRGRIEAVLEGRVRPGDRLAPSPDPEGPEPSVEVRPEASRQATVLEVRTADRAGVVHLVCAALADIGVVVRSAHVTTVGPQAVDVFYLQEESAGALGDGRAASAAHAVRRVLTAPATLGA